MHTLAALRSKRPSVEPVGRVPPETFMGPWYVYALRCSDDSIYIGIATDVVRRLMEHNGLAANPGARYTRARRPVSLVYQEPAASRGDACRREAEIKRMKKKAKEALVAGTVLGRASENETCARTDWVENAGADYYGGETDED